jgi:hypothetical protein
MVDRYTGPELPALDKAQIHVVRALLQLEEMHEFTQASLGLGLINANPVAQALRELGWPIICVPASKESPELYWTYDHHRHRRDVVLSRFESRFYRQWKEEAIEFLAGEPPRRQLPVAASTAKLTGAMSAPDEGTPMYSILYLMLTLHEADPASSGVDPAAFVAGVRQLRKLGWPINLTVKPAAATWPGAIRETTIAAWFAEFGEAAQAKLASGEGHDKPPSGKQKT